MPTVVLYVIVGLGVLVALVLAKRRWRLSPFLRGVYLIGAYIGFATTLVLFVLWPKTSAIVGIEVAFGVGAGLYLLSLIGVFLGTGGIRPSEERFGESLVNYLRMKGVEAEVVDLHAPFWKYQSTNRAIRLTGKNVDEIRLQEGFRGGPQSGDTPAKIYLRVLFNKPLSRAAKRK